MAQPAGPVPAFPRMRPAAGGSGLLPAPPPPHLAQPPAALPRPAKRRGVIDLSDSDDDAQWHAFRRHPELRNASDEEPDRAANKGRKAAKQARKKRRVTFDDGYEIVLTDSDDERGDPGSPMQLDRVDYNDNDRFARVRTPILPPEAGPAPRADHAPPPVDAAQPDARAEAVKTIASILPDVSLAHVEALLAAQPACGPANVEAVLEKLFSTEGGYPKEQVPKAAARVSGAKVKKADRKGKRKAVDVTEDEVLEGMAQADEDQEVERGAKQWLELDRRKGGGKAYEEAALVQLYRDFPHFRQADIKRLFSSSGGSFYAPAYLALEQATMQTEDERGFPLRKGGAGGSKIDKGKAKACDEFEKERTWVIRELPRYQLVKKRAAALAKQLEAEIESGAFFECGCCFADTALSQMITCREGCHFCKDCARMNVDTQIGMRKFVLPCMSTSGCASTFPEIEIVKCVSRKTLAALHKIKQEKEVDEAALEGLEKCPFCPFAMIIENEQERLFSCQRDDCRIVSCRQCKKKDHLPATCAEADSDGKLSTVHRVEEAMSNALIRRCPEPGCGEPYIKETGTCNKIRCNKVIAGYQHFRNAGANLPPGATAEAGSTCDLWDDTDKRNFQEVEAARLAAEAEARKANPAVGDADLAQLKMAKPPPPHAKCTTIPGPLIRAGLKCSAEPTNARKPLRWPRGRGTR
ncbi:hypothetical protein Rhopal_005561-T1 [Rhodotorula paludigena]|uniref:RING-type domain-containing protein n=1 Tax=Rhodotorula paludigena TaxID=86838 RepID=A0AAV5GSN6_9BASI|nr:hypothetical protein Rhopal_005561-T1 [Rhodotorula paludigena]